MHLLVVDHQAGLVVAPDHAACSPGTVEQQHRLHALAPGSDAHAQADVGVVGQSVDSVLYPLQQRLAIALLVTVDVETVGFETAGDALGFGQEGPNFIADSRQYPVAELATVQRVDGMKLFDVDDHGVHVPLGVVLVDAIGVLEKEIAVVQLGQRVKLRRLDQLATLAQLDDATHAGQYDLVHVEGLGDEVCRAHFQRPELGVPLRGEHDDGNGLQKRVFAHAVQYLEAIHLGHDQVQQHHGQLVPVFLDHLQCFPAVGRVQYFIVILQDHAQHIPVDFLVVYNQNQLRFI